MARTEARIFAAIWDDPDFCALDVGAQRLYLFLISQKDLAHDGVIALRPGRWAPRAANLTVTTVGADLAALAAARFVVADEETGELLVRTFMRWDRIYQQPNMLQAALKHLPMVESPRIRTHLADELHRILAECEITARCRAIVEAMLEHLAKGSANPTENPSPNPLGDRGSTTTVVQVVPPLTPGPLAPDPSAPPPADAGGRAREQPTAQTIIGEWLDRVPKRPPKTVIGHVSNHVKALLAEGIDPDDVRRGMAAWTAKGLHPSTLPSVVNEVMNGHARASPGTALAVPGNGRHPPPSTADIRTQQAFDLARYYEEIDKPP